MSVQYMTKVTEDGFFFNLSDSVEEQLQQPARGTLEEPGWNEGRPVPAEELQPPADGQLQQPCQDSRAV